MTPALRRRAGLPAALAAASAVLAGLVALQLRQPSEVPPPALAPAAPAEAAALDPPEPYVPRPLQSYGGIAERPLFSPSRRPTPAGGAAAGKSGHDSLMLAGVILTTSKRLAMVESKSANGAVVVVREGQVIEGWSVETIAADRVVISQNGEVVELLLDDKLKAPRKELRRTPRTVPNPPPEQAPAAAPTPAADGMPAGADGELPAEEAAEEPEGAG
ncbi:MAG TPA: hypothetical protein VLR47_12320 [Rhodospirillales bacterium]|nr:hypothetical protein [Rhodospirillales bacterium]